MSLSDEISKLTELKEKGILSQEEFEQGKKKILSDDDDDFQVRNLNPKETVRLPNGGRGRKSRNFSPTKRYSLKSNDSLGKAANRYVTLQIVMAVIILFVFMIALFQAM